MSNTSLTTKVSQSRGWTLALGIAAAALAAILLIAYLVQYRSSVNDSTAPTPVLVAKNLIPKGTSGHRHRREAALPGRDAREGRPQGRRDLRSGVPQRPGRRRGHLSRPADHDGRPERRLDRRDPDAAHRKAARCCDPGIGRTRARRLRGERRPRRHLLRDRLERRHCPRPSGAERPGHARTGRRGIAGDPPSRCGLAQKLALASDSGTLWFLLRPAGDAKNAPKKSITSTQLLAQINGQK